MKAPGPEPFNVSTENWGYDIESRDPASGNLRFIEVKERLKGATTITVITVTNKEILTGLNRPDAHILAVAPLWKGESMNSHGSKKPRKRRDD